MENLSTQRVAALRRVIGGAVEEHERKRAARKGLASASRVATGASRAKAAATHLPPTRRAALPVSTARRTSAGGDLPSAWPPTLQLS